MILIGGKMKFYSINDDVRCFIVELCMVGSLIG